MFHTHFDPERLIWSGLKTVPTYNPNVSVAKVVLDMLKMNPNKLGQISDNNGRQMSNAEIRTKTIRAAVSLGEMGFGHGDVVAIITRNHHNLAPIVFAAACLAAPVNTLDPNFKKAEISHMFNLTKPKVIFCDDYNIVTVREALLQLQLTVPIFTLSSKVDGARWVNELFIDRGTNLDLYLPTEIEDGTKHPVAIVCSSGTTGHSKGVCLSHATVLEQLSNMFITTSDTVMMSFSSLYWLTGFGTLFITTLKGLTRIITTEPFEPDRMLRIIQQYRVNVTITPPSHLAMLLQCPALATTDLSSLKQYHCGGSLVPDELCTRMNRFLPHCVYVAYGMSEAAGMISSNYPTARPGSVGLVANACTVRIVNVLDGSPCGIDENGEICYRFTYPFVGYYGDAQATAEMRDSDGWMHSGDIGHFDADGYLFVVDRIKDIIKYQGYQISPSEIENAILGLNGVAEVCVVGVTDENGTDLPAAVVVRSHRSTITKADVLDVVTNELSDSKRLRGGVYFWSELPLTPSGKILRRKVKEVLREIIAIKKAE